ncbi:MAG: MlaD family protein [Solirubrobacteraceae bacterium]
MRRRKGRRRKGFPKFVAGAVGIVAIIVFSYLAYTKFANPFANPYTLHAVFSNANGVQPDSLVRIAGVNVGKVTSVSTEPGCKSVSTTANACQAAEVTMTIDNSGLPVHSDATFAIRPRIFLEGNFFVDLFPGTPSAPVARDGHTFPIQQGVEPVQLDQVLTGLQANTRQNLQILLQQYGKAVVTSGKSYNRAVKYFLPAYEYSSLVAHDFLGIQPHDLSNYIATSGSVAGALDTHPQHLKSLVTDFNTTANAFARQNVNLENTIRELPRTLSAALPAFNALNAAFPPLEQLAKDFVPGVRSTGPTVDVSLPFITQLRRLVQPAELRGLTHDLRPTVPALAQLTKESIPLFKNEVRPASSCVTNEIIPWTHLTVPDSHFNASDGVPPRQAYIEGVDFLPGLAGESRVFDANGPYVRILGLGGTLTYSLSPGMFGQSLAPLTSAQPQLPPGGKRPPYVENVPCETQRAITDLSAPTGGAIKPAGGGPVGGGGPLPPLPIPLPPLPLQRKQAAAAALKLVRSSAKADGLKLRLIPGIPK